MYWSSVHSWIKQEERCPVIVNYQIAEFGVLTALENWFYFSRVLNSMNLPNIRCGAK